MRDLVGPVRAPAHGRNCGGAHIAVRWPPSASRATEFAGLSRYASTASCHCRSPDLPRDIRGECGGYFQREIPAAAPVARFHVYFGLFRGNIEMCIGMGVSHFRRGTVRRARCASSRRSRDPPGTAGFLGVRECARNVYSSAQSRTHGPTSYPAATQSRLRFSIEEPRASASGTMSTSEAFANGASIDAFSFGLRTSCLALC